MKEIDRIKKKLIGLIRISEDDAATDGEISNALNMAQQLMAKHNLAREDIDETADNPYEKVGMDRFRSFFYGKKRTAWECDLAHFVTQFVSTAQYYTSTIRDLSGSNRAAVMFYGPSDDAESAADLFREISTAIALMATTRFGGFSRGDGAVYCEGFVNGLSTKLRAEKRKLETFDTETTALMALSDERALALRDEGSQWLAKSCGVKLTQGSGLSGGSGSSSAYRQGEKDGQNYSVTKKQPRKKLA